MRYLGAVLLLIAALPLSGCSPYIGTCSWVVPEASALKVIAPRTPIEGECNCVNCSAPGWFQINRADYTLEFWNGDRWYSHLYLRARSNNGAVLALSSDSPELLKMAAHVPYKDTRGFEYFMRFEPAGSKENITSLAVKIVDLEGQLLGTEVVSLRVETRKDLDVEYL